MKIHSEDLQRIFKYLSPSINSPQKLVEYNSFLFDATEEKLTVSLNNNIIKSFVTLTGEFEEIKFAVDKFIYEIANSLKGEIEFVLNDKNLIVTCGKDKYEFSTTEPWNEKRNKLHTSPLNDFNTMKELFSKSRHCVSLDESRLIYQGYHVRNGYLMATDSYRGILSPINMDDMSVTQKEIDSILSVIDGNVSYNFDDFIYFEFENARFFGSYYFDPIHGEPANLKRIFDEVEKLQTIAVLEFDNLSKLVKPFLIAQKQAQRIGDKKFKLSIRQNDNKVYFSAEVEGVSEIENVIDCELSDSDFEISVNPKLLDDYAKITNGRIEMKIYHATDQPILLTDETDSNYFVMPMI